MTSQQASDLAGQIAGVTVKNHFGSDGFSTKRMFMTVWHEKNQANLRLSLKAQQEFLSLDGEAFSDIDHAWGRQGWTTVHFEYVEKADFQKALKSAVAYAEEKSPKLKAAKKASVKKKTRKNKA